VDVCSNSPLRTREITDGSNPTMRGANISAFQVHLDTQYHSRYHQYTVAAELIVLLALAIRTNVLKCIFQSITVVWSRYYSVHTEEKEKK